jgi:hypothetical protein
MMRERWMWKAVNCLNLDLSGAPLSPRKCFCISAAMISDIMDRLFCSGGSAALSVTDNSRGTRSDMEDMVTVRRITRPVATYLSRARL